MLADMPTPRSLPRLAGVGLKPQHYAEALESVSASIHPAGYIPAWFEVHPQNYFGAGGPPHRWLSAFAERVPLSFHSVGLSLGSADGVNLHELDQLAVLCDRYAPAMVSDHLSWSGSASNRYPDLLPLPYTQDALHHFAGQVARVQDRLARTILIENPSRYLAFAGDEMSEAEFLHALCIRTGCGLLLDINNIEVSAANLGLDAGAMLDAIDPALVGEVHLAGHASEDHAHGRLLIDDHGSPVSGETWRLFERFVQRAGPRPVLIEWDTDVPAFDVLLGEAARAGAIITASAARQERSHALA
ncbi:MNIO family bufferin maturase [Porphyrobacter sp. HT-58-2]|uniref:MNIO family bufferin maturase n=1 Tax=Porphyrobacter sp. HT-58-2 TaxID=2023229 RepID=UPI001F4369B3|nr:DUF692 domain-containing protein [Porphyrobacter sp. HT-58-2]